ncbi:MAG: glycosyltransferase family 9 protein [Alphaproteobacteria bacterium]|nr:glycosyltransferase family 9 protein [Alphaproteobacteria bacterium]
MIPSKQHILVIRLGALGDLVLCFRAFHEIRLAHPNAEIALLVRPAFADFARAMPWFDRVLIDTHPTFAQPAAWLRLRKEIKTFAPDRVYDLQGKRRQTILYALLGGPCGVEWSGAAPLCKFPRPWPPANGMSFQDFLAAQLRAAGAAESSPPDLTWLDAPVENFALPERYAVLIAGCSSGAPHKRWPPEKYAEAAKRLQKKDLACVAIGTKADADALAAIQAQAPFVIDLSNQTNLFELAGILRRATGVIGNDTGPLHMAAAVGTPTLALFSASSDPVWSKPPGEKVAVMQSPILADLSADKVVAAFETLLQHPEHESR